MKALFYFFTLVLGTTLSFAQEGDIPNSVDREPASSSSSGRTAGGDGYMGGDSNKSQGEQLREIDDGIDTSSANKGDSGEGKPSGKDKPSGSIKSKPVESPRYGPGA